MSTTENYLNAQRATKRSPDPVVSSKLIPFRWYGGKLSHLPWLMPWIETDADHFVDVFGGSSVVLINRRPAPIETYNDIDGELVNFFRVLRDQGGELVRLLELTPFSREEFAIACDWPDDDIGALERARRFFVRAEQARTGLAQTASLGRWANCVGSSRRGMSGSVSRWWGKIERLPLIVDRLSQVQIENRPALNLIDAYDSSETFFYLDPPYVHESRSDSRAYAHEMTNDDHRLLADRLGSIQGRFALSGYRSPVMDDLFGQWQRIDAPAKTAHSNKGQRQESLWVNYPVSVAG